MFVAAYIYAKGYEGGAGLQEGARFGALFGLFIAGIDARQLRGPQYRQPARRVDGGRGLVEWTIVGTVIGLVYRAGAVGVAARRREYDRQCYDYGCEAQSGP